MTAYNPCTVDLGNGKRAVSLRMLSSRSVTLVRKSTSEGKRFPFTLYHVVNASALALPLAHYQNHLWGHLFATIEYLRIVIAMTSERPFRCMPLRL